MSRGYHGIVRHAERAVFPRACFAAYGCDSGNTRAIQQYEHQKSQCRRRCEIGKPRRRVRRRQPFAKARIAHSFVICIKHTEGRYNYFLGGTPARAATEARQCEIREVPSLDLWLFRPFPRYESRDGSTAGIVDTTALRQHHLAAGRIGAPTR